MRSYITVALGLGIATVPGTSTPNTTAASSEPAVLLTAMLWTIVLLAAPVWAVALRSAGHIVVLASHIVVLAGHIVVLAGHIVVMRLFTRRHQALPVIGIVTMMGAGPVVAEVKCDPSNRDCIEIGRWNFDLIVGLGVKSNPVVGGDNIPLVVLPKVSYYGEKFFLENLDFGYTLFESETQTLSLLASPGYDRVYFHRNDPQNVFSSPMPRVRGSGVGQPIGPETEKSQEKYQPDSGRRHTTYLSGLDWSYGREHFNVQLSYLHEITGRHNGDEVRFAAAMPLIKRWWHLSATLGATWKSADTVDYYYGEKGIYSPQAALNPFVGLGYETRFDNSWTLKILGHYEKLDDTIANSPFVEESEVLTLFIGGIYSF